MKKTIWIAAGITGMLLGNPAADAKAAVSVNISTNHHPSFVISSRPDFVTLPAQGFSVSVGSPYDIIEYGHIYYLNHNGLWYRSSDYRGPWISIRSNMLPSRIRRHRMEDIRRYRDTEYRRNESRIREQQRYDDNNRRHPEQQRSYDNNNRYPEQNRSYDNDKRNPEQQHSNDIDKRHPEPQRNDDNRK
jgi:hypothetical protein